jgi:hypothetical protein
MNIKPYLYPIASPVLTSLHPLPCVASAILPVLFSDSIPEMCLGIVTQLAKGFEKIIPLADISRPVAIASQVGLDILVSGIALTGSVRAGWNARLSSTQLEAALLTGLSVIGISTAINKISQVVYGIKNFLNLDHTQQYFVLKHNSISSLGGTKACRAVLIDGHSSKWGKFDDDYSHPFGETLYKNCDVRAYRVDGSNSICAKIEAGISSLGGPINILLLQSHAHPGGMYLGDNYWLSTWNIKDIDCLRNATVPTSQIILAGCNTATGDGSIAEKVSQVAKGRQVTGYRADLYRFLGWPTFSEGRMSFFSLELKDSNGDWVLSNPERNFVNPDSSSPGQPVAQEQAKT